MEISIQWGGYYASKESNETEYSVFRLLDFNRYSYQAALFSEKFSSIPTLEEILKLKPFIGHAPIDSRALAKERDLHLLGSSLLTKDDLGGYEYYLEAHETEKSEIEELFTNLIEYSKEPPLKLKLQIIGEELEIEEVNE